MAHHPSQVCLTFGCNGQRSMRLRSDDPPGLYICLWDSALVPHGATLLGPTDRAVAIPFLPWALVEQKSLDRAAQAMWEHERVLGIVCPLPHKMIEQMQACLAADLAAVGSPVACASLGMLRGGGVAHAKFASTVRTRPEIEAIYRWGWKIAMGVSAPQALVQCWDAVLHSCDDGKFQGHVTHTDEKKRLQPAVRDRVVAFRLWAVEATQAPTNGFDHSISTTHPDNGQEPIDELRMPPYHDGKLGQK